MTAQIVVVPAGSTGGHSRSFALPDLGEGLSEGEILRWLVAAGESVELNQPLVEVETAKAAVEIPSPYAGIVEELLAVEGAVVDVGAVIVTFRVEGASAGEGTAATPDQDTPPPSAERAVHLADAGTGPSEDRDPVLVGYGVRKGTVQRRARKGPDTPARNANNAAVAPEHVLAKPPVRKLAKSLGVDLRTVVASGATGSISREDVRAAAKSTVSPSAAPSPPAAEADGRSGADRRADALRLPIKGVRKATAAAMVQSAFTAPHVTLFMTVDVSPAIALVAELRTRPDLAGVKVTPTLLAAKALVLACRRNPEINASWDEAAQEIVLHGEINLGIAAATPRGLLVPNIKAAGRLSLIELADAISSLTATAREGRTAVEDMQNGTITLTNVGSFGVDNGTPILNPGEAAILCLGAIREQPWMHAGAITPRHITQLALSFDHRLVDGQLGASVLADVAAVLNDPTRLSIWS